MTGWLRCAPLCCCAQMLQLQEQLLEAQRAIAARDAEVARLGVRLGAGGPDVGTLSRDQWGAALPQSSSASTSRWGKRMGNEWTYPSFRHTLGKHGKGNPFLQGKRVCWCYASLLTSLWLCCVAAQVDQLSAQLEGCPGTAGGQAAPGQVACQAQSEAGWRQRRSLAAALRHNADTKVVWHVQFRISTSITGLSPCMQCMHVQSRVCVCTGHTAASFRRRFATAMSPCCAAAAAARRLTW